MKANFGKHLPHCEEIMKLIMPDGRQVDQGGPEDRATWWTCTQCGCGFTGPNVGTAANGTRCCMGIICGGITENAEAPRLAIEIDKILLQIVFDCAIHSDNFGSGSLDDSEVDALRAVAVLLGVDPIVATPRNFQCKFLGARDLVPYSFGKPGLKWI